MLHILMLEDDPNDVELMLYILRGHGLDFTWDVADSESDFRHALETSWDIILADFTMPAFDALRALLILNELNKNVPLVVVTGSIGEEAAASLIKKGASDFLLKDHLSDLTSVIQATLSRHEKDRVIANLPTHETT